MQGWWGRGRVALAAALLIGFGPAAAPVGANVGGPDASFGDAGPVVIDVQQGTDVAGPIAALADGRTVGASAGVLVPGDHLRRIDALFVRRLLLDGSPDPTFGVGGVATIPFPGRPVPTTLTVGLLGDVVVAVAVDRPRDGVHTALVVLDPLGGSAVTDLGGAAATRPYHGVDALGRRTVAVQRGTQLQVERTLSGGIPDPFFGLGGTTTLTGALGANPRLDGLVVQPDGRVAAAVDTWGRSWSTPHDGVLVRLGTTGAPDPAVPDRGLGVGVHAAYHAESVGLALDPAGRILVAGPGVVRYLADGSVDPAFTPPDARADLHGVAASADHVFAVGPEHRHVVGSPAVLVGLDDSGRPLPGFDGLGRRELRPVPHLAALPTAVAIRPALLPLPGVGGDIDLDVDVGVGALLGPLLVGGTVDRDLLLAAYGIDGGPLLVDGLLGGPSVTNLARGGGEDLPRAVAVDALGRVVALVATDQTPTATSLVRLGRDGRLDLTYGGTGRVALRHEQASHLALGPGGRADVAGVVTDPDPPGGPTGIVVGRVLAGGTADPVFGEGGRVLLPSDLTAVGAGRVVVTQVVGVHTGLLGPVLLLTAFVDDVVSTVAVRLLPTGALDPTFGIGGIAVIDPTGADVGAFLASALLADGSIAVATAAEGEGDHARIVRLRPDGSPDLGYGVGGRVVVGAPLGPGKSFEGLAVGFGADGAAVVHSSGTVRRVDPSGVVIRSGPLPFEPDGGPIRVLVEPAGHVLLHGGGAVWRLGPSLAPDDGFGDHGLVRPGLWHWALSADGDLVTIGTADRHPVPADLEVGRIDLQDPTRFPEVAVGDPGTVVLAAGDRATRVEFPIALSSPAIHDLDVFLRADGLRILQSASVTIPAGRSSAVASVPLGYEDTAAGATTTVVLRVVQTSYAGPFRTPVATTGDTGTATVVWREPSTPVTTTTTTPPPSPPPAPVGLGLREIRSLGGLAVGRPALAATSSGLVAFARGVDDQLWSRPLAPGAWQGTGGVLRAAPTTAVRGAATEVFATGTDGALWWRTCQPAAHCGGWVSLGGQLVGSPAAVATGTGQVDVFARGVDDQLWQRRLTGGRWAPWVPLGGRLTSPPAVAGTAAGARTVSARGADGAAWALGSVGDGWGRWTRVGGWIVDEPAVVAGPGGSIHVLARGGDDALWSSRRRADGSFTAFVRHGGALTSAPVASATGTTATTVTVVVACRGRDGAVWVATTDLP